MCTCWFSSMISASPPPLRDTGVFLLMAVEGVELMARWGAGMLLGPVGDVRWGPVSNQIRQSIATHGFRRLLCGLVMTQTCPKPSSEANTQQNQKKTNRQPSENTRAHTERVCVCVTCCSAGVLGFVENDFTWVGWRCDVLTLSR